MSELGASKLGVLPSLSYGPVTAEAPPVVSYDGVADAFTKLADDAGDIANHYFGKKAATEGYAAGDPGAVAVDASGKPQMPSPSWEAVLSGQSAVFENAAKFRFLSDSAVAARPQVEDLKGQYPQDPIGLKGALDRFTGQKLSQTPSEFQPAVRDMLNKLSADALADVTKQKWEGDAKRTQGSADALLSDLNNQLTPYAAANNLQDPRALGLMQQYRAVLDNKLKNPIFNYSPEQANKDWNDFTTNLEGQAAVGQAPRILQDAGGNRALAEQRFTNLIDGLPLPFDKAEAYKAKGLAAIHEQDTLARQANTAAQQAVTSKVDDAKAYALSGGAGGWRAKIPETQIRSLWPKPVADQKVEALDEADRQGAMLKTLALSSPAEIEAMKPQYAAPGGPAPAPGGFDKAWQFTLQHEGGYAAHDANGAPVNFGINQAAHPGVDVKNLTPAQAKQIAKTDYWNAIHGDSLPPAMQAAAFDTAYIFGPKAAQLMADQADGDPQKLIDIREQRMQQMIADDPAKFGKFADAWQQRNDDLRSFVTGSGTEAAQLKLHNAFTEAVKQRQTAIADDPASYVRANVQSVGPQLDSADPATRRQGAAAMLFWQSHIGVPPAEQTIFTKYQAKGVHDMLLSGDPQQAASALQGIASGLTDQQLRIAARQIAPNNAAFAAAFSTVSHDPGLARNIIVGERYLLANPDVKPNGITPKTDFDSYTGNLFQFAPEARARAVATANALYAYGKIGMASAYDSDAYRKAISAAVGNIFSFRGGQTIPAPAPGMDYSATEDMMQGLTASDVARYGNGQPIYANGKAADIGDIARNGVLSWTGTPGIYRVSLPGQGFLGATKNPYSRQFMLNLGAKASGALPPIPAPPPPVLSSAGTWSQ